MAADKIKIPVEDLEKLFCKAEPVKEEKKEEDKKPDKVQKVSKVDGKAQQNTAIFLKTLKKTNNEVREIILTLSHDVLTEEMTRKLIDNWPSDEDTGAIRVWDCVICLI